MLSCCKIPLTICPGLSQPFTGAIFSARQRHIWPTAFRSPSLARHCRNSLNSTHRVWKSTPSEIRGEVLHIDHFGNIITSIGHLAWIETDRLQLTPQFGTMIAAARYMPRWPAASRLGDHTARTRIRPTYGSVPPGTLTALVGSSGQLEIGMNQGNAAQALGVSSGRSGTC